MLTAIKGREWRIEGVERTESDITFTTAAGRMRLAFVTPDIVRVRCTANDGFAAGESPMLVPLPTCTDWTAEERPSEWIVQTTRLKLRISRTTCALSWHDAAGRLLTREPARGGKTLDAYDAWRTILDETAVVDEIQTADGVKKVVRDARKEFYRTLYHAKLEFEWQPGEALYGLGQQEEGVLNLRGTRQYVHQANMKIAVPTLVSTNGYGILMNACSGLIFSDDAYGSYLYAEAVDELDWFFVRGDRLDDVIAGYRLLTGRAAMLPKWALGFMLSQERYETADEMLTVVDEYERRGIPLDCIVLDWQSWEDERWGQKSFDRTRFPDVPAFVRALHARGVRFMISIWPNMHPTTANHAEMAAAGCLFQSSEIYDAFSPEARALYWKQADEGLFSQGVDAWWCDSSEPFTPEWNQRVKPEPDRNYREFHDTAKVYMPEEMTNAYPLLHARTMFDGQRGNGSDKRVVNLTRSAYAGIQRYGAILWSGDISASWDTLRRQIPNGLNFCASGIPYWTFDIGAFFVKRGNMWYWNGEFEDGVDDNGYRELYVRWHQLGAFLPVFRSHGTDARREIWRFGEPSEPFYDAIAETTFLRYRLMPYLYSLAAAAHFDDATMMRLLAFDFADDPRTHDVKDQFLLGSSLMVCPITRPMYWEAGSTPLPEDLPKTREVLLPEGTGWYCLHDGTRFAGGSTITVDAPLDRIPVFVRAGSILPTVAPAKHTGQSSESEIELTVYPGADGRFVLYFDDGDGYACEEGAFERIPLEWDDAAGTLAIGAREGSEARRTREIRFTVSRADFPECLPAASVDSSAANAGGKSDIEATNRPAVVMYRGSPLRIRMQ